MCQNPAKITVTICEQKPYPAVWFSIVRAGAKAIPQGVNIKHSLNVYG